MGAENSTYNQIDVFEKRIERLLNELSDQRKVSLETKSLLEASNKMVKTLGTSNELIARDESMHTEFAIALYHHLKNKLDNETIINITKEAVEIEEEFIIDSIKCSMIGMNEVLMRQYIRFVADRLLIQLGCPKIYNDENPFAFMDTIGLDGKTNFFEKRVTEYQLAENVENNNIDFSSDF